MIVKLIRGMRKALGLHRPGRNLDVLPDDVFILSFPKSGNTWTRFLVANLAYPETPADFSNINRLTPDPEVLSKRALARMPRPRILKSHQYFHPGYKRVIYVVRDPRDVALSQFHFHRKRKLIEDDYPIEKFVSRFVAGETGPYGSWGDNVASWLSTRHNRPGFLLLRYEDMLDDTARELAKVATFLDIPPDPARIRNAVARSAADEMRKLEKSQALQWSSTKETRQDVPFVRAAKAGGWRTGLPESAVAELEAAWRNLMTYLGYELRFPERSTNFDSRFVEPILNGPAR
jgi:sulfotransferase family protein